MKTIFFKAIAVLFLSFTLVQNSSAYGSCFYRGYAPHCYARERYVGAPFCGRPLIPGHFIIDRWGARVWVGPYCR